MKNYWFMVLRYMISGEDSRYGFQDFWRSNFLARHTTASRACLEATKVMFLIAVYFGILETFSRF
ncbi:MAG: hypothetical protein MI892_16540 [Desulfobacterales bacterium]|nr:hypothetical protein [Desulfobacterales bacterium]